MPAPIEEFHESNQNYLRRLKTDGAVLLGGCALILVGAALESPIISGIGGVLGIAGGVKAARDDYRHEVENHELNMK